MTTIMSLFFGGRSSTWQTCRQKIAPALLTHQRPVAQHSKRTLVSNEPWCRRMSARKTFPDFLIQSRGQFRMNRGIGCKDSCQRVVRANGDD